MVVQRIRYTTGLYLLLPPLTGVGLPFASSAPLQVHRVEGKGGGGGCRIPNPAGHL